MSDMQLLKNSEHIVKIDGYSSEGLGITRVDGFVCFVKGALYGEKCKIKIIKVSKNCCWARLQAVFVPSPARIKPDCQYYKLCGGCSLRHMTYDEELRLKEKRINDALWKIAKLDIKISQVFPGNANGACIERYRNKAVFPVSRKKNGGIEIGLYQARSHNVVDVKKCKLQSEQADIVIATVRQWMNEYSISAYIEESGKGLLRHIFVRTNYKNEVLVCLVTNYEYIPHFDKLKEMLVNNCEHVYAIVQNINSKKVNTIRGSKYKTIYGPGTIIDELCGLKFELDTASFFQINRIQAENLYTAALDMADISKKDLVLDLYCGTGTITLLLAKRAQHAIGVEIVEQAILNAKKNAKRNDVTNVDFICSNSKNASADLLKKGISPDVICVDPPRKGLDVSTIESCVKLQPKQLVYISCKPETLARDLRIFKDSGYDIENVIMVDMFPRTAHVETAVLLKKCT